MHKVLKTSNLEALLSLSYLLRTGEFVRGIHARTLLSAFENESKDNEYPPLL